MENKNGEFNNLEWGEIVVEINIMMNVGSVIIVIVFVNVLYEFIKYLDVLNWFREEVDVVFDLEEVVVLYDKVKYFFFLWVCFDEFLWFCLLIL